MSPTLTTQCKMMDSVTAKLPTLLSCSALFFFYHSACYLLTHSPVYLFTVPVFFFFNIYLFIWLLRVLFAACGISSWGMRDLVPWPEIEPGPPALGVQSLNHLTTRKVPVPVVCCLFPWGQGTLFCSLRCLEQCLVHNSSSLVICWVN